MEWRAWEGINTTLSPFSISSSKNIGAIVSVYFRSPSSSCPSTLASPVHDSASLICVNICSGSRVVGEESRPLFLSVHRGFRAKLCGKRSAPRRRGPLNLLTQTHVRFPFSLTNNTSSGCMKASEGKRDEEEEEEVESKVATEGTTHLLLMDGEITQSSHRGAQHGTFPSRLPSSSSCSCSCSRPPFVPSPFLSPPFFYLVIKCEFPDHFNFRLLSAFPPCFSVRFSLPTETSQFKCAQRRRGEGKGAAEMITKILF